MSSQLWKEKENTFTLTTNVLDHSAVCYRVASRRTPGHQRYYQVTQTASALLPPSLGFLFWDNWTVVALVVCWQTQPQPRNTPLGVSIAIYLSGLVSLPPPHVSPCWLRDREKDNVQDDGKFTHWLWHPTKSENDFEVSYSTYLRRLGYLSDALLNPA